MGKFSTYKIPLSSLPEGRYEQDFVIDTEFFKNMEISEVLQSDVKVHLVLDHKHEAYDCTFHLEGELQVPCDRCLDPLSIPVDTEYHLTVKYGETYSDDSDDVLVIPYSSSSLNVSYMLKDTLLLMIPMRKVHPAGSCNKAMTAALHKHGGGDSDEDTEFLDDEELDDSADGTGMDLED